MTCSATLYPNLFYPTMRFYDADAFVSLYEYPFAGLFRNHIQVYTPLQPLADPQTPEPARAADNSVVKDSPKTSLFKGLSLELSRNIFMLACEEGALAPSKDSPQDQLRLTLQLVCKDWRWIVTGYPELWNDLDLRIMPRRGQRSNDVGKVLLAETEASLDCTRSWLRRAGNSLISLRLLMFPCVKSEAAQHRERIMSFLSAYQFKALAIRTPILSMLDFDKSLDVSLEHVESLSLTAPNWDYPETHLFSYRPPFPWLKSLSLTMDDRHMYANLLYAFPWHQLEQVTLGTIKQPCLVAEVLRRCKSLVDCTIHIQEYNEATLLNDICLPRLRHMSIVSNIVGLADDSILTATIAPNLESLSISSLFGMSPLTYAALGIMAVGCNIHTNLQKLALRSFDGVMDLGQVLTLFPALRIVELFNATIDVYTACCLSYGALGPHLQELRLSGYDFRPTALLDMIEDRQKNAKVYSWIARFTSVLLSFPPTQFADISLEHFERAAVLQDEHEFELALGVFQAIPDYDGDVEDEAERLTDESGRGSEDEAGRDGAGQGSDEASAGEYSVDGELSTERSE